jgi:hypothetical protein
MLLYIIMLCRQAKDYVITFKPKLVTNNIISEGGNSMEKWSFLEIEITQMLFIINESK